MPAFFSKAAHTTTLGLLIVGVFTVCSELFTVIAGRNVPVHSGPRTKVYFCGHCKKGAAGFYEFWTMKNEESWLHVGRRPGGSDPGERFRMMEDDPHNQKAWADAQTAVLVRPSTQKDLEEWLNDPDHVLDAPCAQHGELNGQPITIGRNPVDGHYIVR